LEAVTWKRLGLYLNPIVLLNVRGFFDPLLALFERAIRERFMDERHRSMWSVAGRPEEVIPAIEAAPSWSVAARDFATL
jgi:predicted Rossmann-fold nucleotide-binding protein